MANVIKVRPMAGVLVCNPLTMIHLPEAGLSVEWSRYWQKQIDQGYVEIVTAIPLEEDD